MSAQINIVITDDYSVVRQGAFFILKNHFQNTNILQTSDFKELLELLSIQKIDLILLDINIPGGNSISMIDKIRAIQKEVKILVFSAYEEKTFGLQFVKAGANGYLNKNDDEKILILAVEQTLLKGRYYSPELKEILINQALNQNQSTSIESLSERELEIASLLVAGEGNIEIANRLSLHLSTVSTYKKRIFKKLNINNVVDLVKLLQLQIKN